MTDSILRAGDTCWRRAPAERVAFLVDGDAYFRACADAMERARRSIIILGWDLDSRIHLRRDGAGAAQPLAKFLDACVQANGDLHIHVLLWDFAMIYALEREPLPMFQFGWRTHPRVHFHTDGEHPLGASHHQKLVVVDNTVAFAGGLDLTKVRWDTPQHLPRDERRVTPNGVPYAPFHDMQMMVDGQAAAALGEIARYRWAMATGERLTVPDGPGDPWPEGWAPAVRDVTVGICRTLPEYKDQAQVREIERFHQAAIAAARETIYLENQYFTSNTIREALEARLRGDAPPEIALVLPRESAGWLEQTAMDTLRARQIKRLREADPGGRFRVYDASNGADAEAIMVHSKLMIVDGRMLIHGSANLSNRSMGLDTECNLALAAGPEDEALREAISALQWQLLGEHLDAEPATVAGAVREHGSLLAALEALRKKEGRTLRPLEARVPAWMPEKGDDPTLLDPERPVALERMIDTMVHDGESQESGPARRGLWLRLGAIAAVVLGLAVFWKLTPQAQGFDRDLVLAWLRSVEQNPASILWMLLAYLVAALTMFPITPLIGATALIFNPWIGLPLALAGSMGGALLTFGLGRALGRQTMRQLLGRRLNDLSRRLARRGLMTIVVLRLIPVAPFTVVNLVAGATHISFRDFAWGTLLGMTPGIVLVLLVVGGAKQAMLAPTPFNLSLLGAAGLAALLLAWWANRRLRRRAAAAAEE